MSCLGGGIKVPEKSRFVWISCRCLPTDFCKWLQPLCGGYVGLNLVAVDCIPLVLCGISLVWWSLLTFYTGSHDTCLCVFTYRGRSCGLSCRCCITFMQCLSKHYEGCLNLMKFVNGCIDIILVFYD